MGWDVDFWVDGQPVSGKNRRRIVPNRRTGKSMLIKSETVMEYEASFNAQCPRLDQMLEGDLVLWIDAYYKTRRPDLNCTELIKDLLQEKIYANDRQVKVEVAMWNLSKDNPGVRIRLRRINSEGCTEMSSLEPSMILGMEPPDL